MTQQHPDRLLSDDLETRIGALCSGARPVVTGGSAGTTPAGGADPADDVVCWATAASWSSATESRLVHPVAAAPVAAAPVAAAPVARPAATHLATRSAGPRTLQRESVVRAVAPPEQVEVSAAEIIAAIAEGRVPRGRHRDARPECTRPVSGPRRMRRPTLYLAAALVGATGIGLLTAGGDPAAQADTASAGQPTSVAEALGLQAAPSTAVTEDDAVVQLQQMAASRAQRETEQAAAVQVQAAADQAAIDARAAAEAAAVEAARPQAVAPVAGARLSSTFGYRWGTLHAGIDLAAPMLTPEYAVMAGVVLQAGPASGFGQAVYVQHENGDVTIYGHMEQILVTAGQVVQAGDTIALLGNRGQSTGPHLHFEVHVGGMDGEKVDPLPWLAARGVVLS